jgi:hypothetical protein
MTEEDENRLISEWGWGKPNMRIFGYGFDPNRRCFELIYDSLVTNGSRLVIRFWY